MNLIWRFLWVLFFSRFKSPLTLFDQSCKSFTVLPTDIDILRHMNNGRYLSLMDLARIDFLIRNKILSKLAKNKIYGVVASEMIRFKKSLNLFAHFQIYTKLLGWDDKFFYVIQHFKRDNTLYATGVVKIRFLQQTGTVSPDQIKEIMGFSLDSPALPSWINDWLVADNAILTNTQDLGG